jgi:hypothetical protein
MAAARFCSFICHSFGYISSKELLFGATKKGRMWRKRGYLLREDGSERPALTWLREYLQRQVQKLVFGGELLNELL